MSNGKHTFFMDSGFFSQKTKDLVEEISKDVPSLELCNYEEGGYKRSWLSIENFGYPFNSATARDVISRIEAEIDEDEIYESNEGDEDDEDEYCQDEYGDFHEGDDEDEDDEREPGCIDDGGHQWVSDDHAQNPNSRDVYRLTGYETRPYGTDNGHHGASICRKCGVVNSWRYFHGGIVKNSYSPPNSDLVEKLKDY